MARKLKTIKPGATAAESEAMEVKYSEGLQRGLLPHKAKAKVGIDTSEQSAHRLQRVVATTRPPKPPKAVPVPAVQKSKSRAAAPKRRHKEK